MADWARPVVVFQIRGRDTAKLRKFYAELFNWKIDDSNPGVGDDRAYLRSRRHTDRG
jgi:predicted enzyme related to lactoylglutathione lyase